MFILLVEDDPGDQKLFVEALKLKPRRHELQIANNGELAVEILTRQGRFRDAFSPDLIILDLNLPRLDGWEVLSVIKRTQGLKRIPVVIFTTSKEPAGVARCYDLDANCFVCKPSDLEKFFSVVGDIEEFWSQHVHFPNRIIH